MPEHLPDKAGEWLDRPTFVTLATQEGDGRAQLSVLWARRDGDDIVMSTVKGRHKHVNLMRDPRATVMVIGPDNPYDFLEVRGSVTMTEQGGRELIDELSAKYTGQRPYENDVPGAVRVVMRLSPLRIRFRG